MLIATLHAVVAWHDIVHESGKLRDSSLPLLCFGPPRERNLVSRASNSVMYAATISASCSVPAKTFRVLHAHQRPRRLP